jgi:hypothetical protein
VKKLEVLFSCLVLSIASLAEAASPTPSPSPRAEHPSPESAALVYALTGPATVRISPAATPRPLNLFEWLPESAEIATTTPGSRVAVAFWSGNRYELKAKGQARVAHLSLEATSGNVTRLPQVPNMPNFEPLADEKPGDRPGATRLRAEPIRHLYPARPAIALADSVTLRFEPAAAARYQVRIENDDGSTAYETQTASAQVVVPPAALRPGNRYFWTVRTVTAAGWSLYGSAEFRTLDADRVRDRDGFRKALGDPPDASSLALMAVVDRRLGLLAEAQAELRAAVQLSPGDAELARALADVTRQIASTE